MRGEVKGEFLGAIFVAILLIAIILPNVSAGVGLKWNQESALVPQNSKACLTYYVYNPWNKDSYVRMVLSKNLEQIVTSSFSETKLVKANTSSNDSIPIKFCFKAPQVYPKDCLIGNSLICKQTCNGTMKVYSGDVEEKQVSSEKFKSGGSGGSMTQMSLSAPLRIRVQCVPHGRNYSLVYALIAIIAAILLVIDLRRKRKGKKASGNSKGKGKKDFDKGLEEKNKKLEEKIKALEKKQQKKSKAKKTQSKKPKSRQTKKSKNNQKNNKQTKKKKP